MHKQNIVHRDIKPENILLVSQDSFKIKVCDFGLSTVVENEGLKDMVGTPYYLAPEILRKEKYNEKCDIWSLGILLYELLCGDCPFEADTKKQMLNKIISEDPPFE
jgi:calcium-dependent protein kinase